jgi:2-(1,2-epoxy-1,2-dihydrophenyl)acetyl-CoA isomerase
MARRAELTVEQGVARLRLVRADAGNAIDPEMVDGIAAAVAVCRADRGVRALLISAEGPSFTVGGDLNHLGARLGRLAQELDEMIG